MWWQEDSIKPLQWCNGFQCILSFFYVFIWLWTGLFFAQIIIHGLILRDIILDMSKCWLTRLPLCLGLCRGFHRARNNYGASGSQFWANGVTFKKLWLDQKLKQSTKITKNGDYMYYLPIWTWDSIWNTINYLNKAVGRHQKSDVSTVVQGHL